MSQPHPPFAPPACARRRLVRVERHELGPRCYLAGRRVHECFLGLTALVAAGVLVMVHLRLPLHLLAAMTAVGVWMVAKDWRDFVPSLRDSAAWSAGLHRRRLELRTIRRGDGLPAAFGALVAIAGLVNVASVLTPDIADRARLLQTLVPPDLIAPAHALALPAGAALVVVALHLARRRRRAWALATALLLVLGALDLLKGLDVEEAAASWATAGLLIWGRDAFHVRARPGMPRATLRWAPVLVSAAIVVAVSAIWAARIDVDPAPGWGSALREAVGLLTLTGGPLHFSDDFSWLPAGVGMLGVGVLLALAALVFRPVRPCAVAPDRVRARRLLLQHGSDTLSYFKLRGDLSYLFSSDRRAFLGYRIEGGTLLVAGEPVGPAPALPALLRELVALAERHGLHIAVLGAGRVHLDLWRQAGLRPLYLGDEAIVDTRSFSLAGRPIRKVRQSVARLERQGYRTDVADLGTLAPAALGELERVSASWRGGAPERGFAMALDGLDGGQHPDSVIVVARDGDGRARGFLQFAPCYGRAAMSLAAMRRERDTPNGLTEFMVASAIALLRERGVAELSLNFAVLARVLRGPRGPLERALRLIGRRADAHFQLESLYRFNAKFFPRWEPRYLLYEGTLGLPRATLAALWAEGQIPRLRPAPARDVALAPVG